MTDIINIRNLTLSDYQQLKEAMLDAYGDWNSYWREHQIENLLVLFPEGQIAITVNDIVVGCALSIVVDYNIFGDTHSFKEITGNYTFSTHKSKGDTLYGIEVFIRSDYRGKRLGRRLYDARKELCENLNLKAIIFGGRIPGYHEYMDQMTPKEYIQKVKGREIIDSTLTFQIANDFHVKKVLKNYMPGDEESGDYAVLMQWDNIYYQESRKMIGAKKQYVRLGLVQWQMRIFSSFEDLKQQVEYFIDALAAYKSDFALFPELFHAPLMADENELSELEAILKLSSYTKDLTDFFSELSVKYNINIITGSMPECIDGSLYNVGYLCHRNGKIDRYEKLHVTPDEAKAWGLKGGWELQAFDSDCGKVGILICYDVEFPELTRVLADDGIQILFVPFLTDTQTAYSRVRYCAQARAIENECFVAIAGSVGNLPRVKNMDIQYAQSAVFTPCDFAFPSNGIKGEATPNTEMILVVDVDLTLLDDLHSFGSVKNLTDRRIDLFEITCHRRKV
ncbi:MAG: bifunctional GNAT family N-acetyltransferase/carbon-nitrogen hydrolase family protein [Bacteroidota bacterium]|nr:bifunctional GNAT family N-acetyltransferase/carbon-nitrogen hydrolase family protein [Bacteroidota bacterium]